MTSKIWIQNSIDVTKGGRMMSYSKYEPPSLQVDHILRSWQKVNMVNQFWLELIYV